MTNQKGRKLAAIAGSMSAEFSACLPKGLEVTEVEGGRPRPEIDLRNGGLTPPRLRAATLAVLYISSLRYVRRIGLLKN